MIDHIEIGPVPANEVCQQVGTRDYDPIIARAECDAFRSQIRRVCGQEPDGARLVIKSNPHDFGSYYEVAVKYDEDVQAAVNYAFAVESADLSEWDAEARKQLGLDTKAHDETASAEATAYVEWGGAYDTRELELIEYPSGRYFYEDKTGGHVSLTQATAYTSRDAAKQALLRVVFALGESNSYIDFGSEIIRKRDYKVTV